MSNNILRLTRLHLKGTLEIGAGFTSKDERKWKKSLGILAVYVLVGFFAVLLITAVSNTLAVSGFAHLIPGLVTMITVVLIFIFNVFRSGATVFDLKLFETEAALPVTSFQIVSSRFLVQYIVNLVLAIVFMTPGLIVCGLYLPIVSPIFLIGSILGVLLAPLIPLTLSTAIGAFLYAISARMKHRKMIITILGLLLMVAVFVAYFMFISTNISNGTSLPASLSNLIVDKFGVITDWCVPATLLSEGILGSILSLIYFVGISIGLYLGLLFLVSWKYRSICQAMQIKDARHNYVMHNQKANTIKKSLFHRDFKRYSSSTAYVFNTLFGYILMVVLGIAILCGGGNETVLKWGSIGILPLLCAFGLAFLASMSSTTSASISIEGKNWWITQTLPVSAKEIYSSKIKVNFILALPFYLISEILIFIALKPSVLSAIVLIILPLVYIYFMSVFGLRAAANHPKFEWKTETEAVKQGVGLMLSVLVTFATLLVAFVGVIALAFLFGGIQETYSALFLSVFSIIMLGITILMHRKLNRKEIIDIE